VSPTSRLRAFRSTLVSVSVVIAATLARPADLPPSERAGQEHRDPFREAMRHRDLGKWQEALILFETARKQNGAEAERRCVRERPRPGSTLGVTCSWPSFHRSTRARSSAFNAPCFNGLRSGQTQRVSLTEPATMPWGSASH
jgi:hypothetical protein